MTDYTKTTDFAIKDTLPPNDAGKVIRGSEFDAEFNNLATHSATKFNKTGGAITGAVSMPSLTVSGTVTAGTISGSLATGFTVDGGTY